MHKCFFLPLVLLIFHHAQSQPSPSIIKEYKKNFKTYDFSDPDPIARMEKIYPYFRFDGYTDKPVNKEWKVVELENDYIKLIVLPEIGGKIWGAWEKSTGKPFLYYNQVVKFRDVAMRGPWTSGGLEANYGIIGHTPNCATPVDYTMKTNSDGSVSCYIGTLDLLTQTYWTLEINLPKDKGYFITRAFWYNSTPLEQPYYTWMNTGIKAAGNLEFIYPGTRYIGHVGEYADWKINRENGKDISFYEQNNFGEYKSYHVFGKYADFFGAYWHQDKFGMGRYSTHDDKAGKKIWIWGLSQQGMIWDKLLTDTDGQYVEVQSGRLFNQGSPGSTYTPFKHPSFAPSRTDTWTEYWFPVLDIGGFVKANPYGALNIHVYNGYLKIDFSPLQDIREELKIMEGENQVYAKTVDLKTLKVFSDSIKFSGNPNRLNVTLGATKLQFNTDPKDGTLERPVNTPEGFDWTSVYGLHLQAKEDLAQRFYVPAEEKLKNCLAKDPNYLPALGDMAMLMYRNLEYQKSLDYAKHALSIDTYDAAGNFYYGLANLQLDHIIDAKDGFDIASLSGEFRSAAFAALSKIYFKENDFDKALHYAHKSLEVNSANLDALQLMAVTYRMINEREKATATLESLTKLNPLNHFTRFEEYYLKPSDKTQTAFTSMIRNELAGETYLQLADWYASLGMAKEGLEVLGLAPPNPEALYWMAFLKDQLKEKDAKSLIDKANQMSPELVFPFRSSSQEVLSWVMQQSDHWKPKYYSGLIFWSRNNKQRAAELFAQCGSPDFAPFYALRATLLNDGHYADDLKAAAKLAPGQWRYGKLLIQHFIEAKNYTEALATAKQYHTKFPQDFRISMLLAQTLLLNKQYKACTDLLGKTTILPYEGATDGRQLYRDAWLMQGVQLLQQKKYKVALASIGKSKLWPEALGAGKPYEEDIDSRLENYMEGVCYEKSKNPTQAAAKWNAVVSSKAHPDNSNNLITALALAKLNRREEGNKLLHDWVRKDPENKVAQWSIAVFNGNQSPLAEAPKDGNFSIVKALTQIP